MGTAGMSAALAQQNGPAADEPIEPGIFHLHRLEGYMEFEGRVEQTRVRSRDSRGRTTGRQTNRDRVFRESFGLRFDADIFHPALMQLEGQLSFGLTQSRFQEQRRVGGETDSDGGYLTTYDLRLNLFSAKPISGSVYASRSDDRIARRFLPSLREKRNRWGTSWVFKHKKFPIRLTYEQSDTDRTGNSDPFNDEHLGDYTLRLEGQWLISDSQTLDYSYEHGRLQQEYQGSNFDFDTRHDEFVLRHDLNFGPEDRHNLHTLLRYRTEQGNLARDLLEFGPQLTLQHNPNLSTRYTYQFYQEEFDQLKIDSHRADFQLVHQLFTNLTTTYDLFGLHEKTEDDLETYQWGTGIDFQYNRKNPYGRLRANLSYRFDSTRYDGDDGLRFVSNEAGTFRDPRPIRLLQRNVQPQSLVVTDITGTTFYSAGIDYFPSKLGDRLLLARNPSGRIADDDTVLIDYLYRTPTDGQLDNHRIDLGLAQDFSNGLTPYYDLQYRIQEVDRSTGMPLEEDRLERHRIGLEYRRDRWSTSAEYEIFDDSIEPFTAFHLNGDLDVLRKPGNTLGMTAAFSRFLFEGGFDDRNVSLLDLGMHHRYTLSNDLTWWMSTAYRFETDSVDGHTSGVDVEAGVEYQIGDLTVDLSAEYDLLNIEEDRQDGFGVWLRVRRELGNLLARR